MDWQEISFAEVVKHLQGKTLVGEEPNSGPEDSEVYVLSDGSRIAAISEWSGPYSEYTPDGFAMQLFTWPGLPDKAGDFLASQFMGTFQTFKTRQVFPA